MRTYYCELCGEWFRAKAQIDIPHNHSGCESNFMFCKPAGMKIGSAYIGIKPVYNSKRWRVMLLYIEQGYSQNPSWGHEAGGWIHYTYEAMRDLDNHFIEAPTEKDIIQKLASMPNIQLDNYFKYCEPLA